MEERREARSVERFDAFSMMALRNCERLLYCSNSLGSYTGQ